jgi:hypothetical protein
MRLDHVSYVASHDQISDVVNRIGSQIGTAFVDGGIHPKFGTRNFTAPLLNGQYIEVVCPLDHPATDATPFGKAVKKKADAGGGWLTWVLASDDMNSIEKRIGRGSVSGHRRKPDGTELTWDQIGVLNVIEDAQLPFFVKWKTGLHPSKDGLPIARIKKISINGLSQNIEKWTGLELGSSIPEIKIYEEWNTANADSGIFSIELVSKDKNIVIN